jgi:hypothetical protein
LVEGPGILIDHTACLGLIASVIIELMNGWRVSHWSSLGRSVSGLSLARKERKMSLLYSISGDEEDQLEEATTFLTNRWCDVIEDDAVRELCNALSSSAWTAESFEVMDVEVGDKVRVHFTFEAKGLDKKSKASGDRVSGSAVAVIDEYDGIKFVEVEVE